MLPFPHPSRPRDRADALLAVALLAIGQWQVWGGWHDGGVGLPPDGHHLPRAVLAAALTVPLAWRRRHALTVTAVICAAIVCQLLAVVAYVPFLAGLVPMAIANYTGAAYAGRWRPASLVLVLLTEAVVYARIPAERVEGEILFGVFVALGTWIVGDVVRTRSHRARRALGDAQLLVAQSEAATAAALAEERGAIARELHDVIAHSVSVMGVQAGAARLLIERDPDAARAALLEVEAAARSSVDELRRLLAVLRDDDRGAERLAPQPGLAQLDGLVGQVRAAGLDVSLRVAEGLQVPPGLELVVFRIVQEALTNALKHAGTPTRVAVGREHGVVSVEVANDGPTAANHGAAVPAAGSRHGLIGMRERVQLYGGTWCARHTAEGGFVVRAQLPVRDASVLDPVS